jgi:hypothetical protein
MPALLTLLLLAATVDPRLTGPVQLLAQLHATHPSIPNYSRTLDVLHLKLQAAPLPPGAGGHYEPGTRMLTMAEALLAEDPGVMAAGLAHELTHASDFDLIAVELLERNYTELEARAFEAQAISRARSGPTSCRGGASGSVAPLRPSQRTRLAGRTNSGRW